MFFFFWPVDIPRALNTGTRESASSRVTYFILRAYTGTGVSHSQHREKKNREGFGKNAGEWTSAVSVAFMTIK